MTGRGESQRDALADSTTSLLLTLIVLAAVAISLPGLLLGVVIALVLRALRLRWTWGVLIAAGLAVPIAVTVEARVALVRVQAERVLDGRHVDWWATYRLLWPLWLLVAGVCVVVVKRTIDRRARLHGGRGERELERELGPVALIGRSRRRRRARRLAATGSGGTLLGQTRLGEPVLVPALRAHAMIVGGSGTGKTTTAEVLLEGEARAGRGFVILDGRGGRQLPAIAVELGERLGRPVALWSVLSYGDARLDAWRRSWNPAGGGNATEVKDRIAAAEEQTEPYYAAVAARGLLIAARAAGESLGRDPGLSELVALLDAPVELADLLRSLDPERYEREVRWLSHLTESERNGVRGMASRLDTMINSDGGEWLLPAEADTNAESGEIDLYRAVRDGWLVVFSLPEGIYPALIPHVCRYALAALNAVATRLEREGQPANAVVFVDELSAFDGDQLCGGLERGRSAGMSYVVASQSVSNFRSAGGEKLLDAIFDNSELAVIHRQSSPRAVEELAGLGGTAEAWEHTHSVDDRAHGGFGADETGNRTRRLAEQYRAHPNTIRALGIGEAILIRNRPNGRADPRPRPPTNRLDRRVPVALSSCNSKGCSIRCQRESGAD